MFTERKEMMRHRRLAEMIEMKMELKLAKKNGKMNDWLINFPMKIGKIKYKKEK